MQNITGKDNIRIKTLLKARKDPRKAGFVFVEGLRTVTDAFSSGMKIESLFMTEEKRYEIPEELINYAGESFIISGEAVDKIAQTVNTQGVFALVRMPDELLTQWSGLPDCKRLMICDGVSDPGNMGNVIRSADAFGFDGVLLSRDCVSPYNEKVIRASAGSVFHIRIFETGSMEEAVSMLRESGFTICATALEGHEMTQETSFRLPCGLIVGNEGNGISDAVLALADTVVKIPMRGRAESLNVASAASIMAFLVMQSE